jgi:hypothetical protein
VLLKAYVSKHDALTAVSSCQGCCRQPAFPALLCSCWCDAVRRQLPTEEMALTADAVVVAKVRGSGYLLDTHIPRHGLSLQLGCDGHKHRKMSLQSLAPERGGGDVNPKGSLLYRPPRNCV